MLLTIHNLPAATRYADVKSLLQSKCGIQQVILDNLVSEGNCKKVTVGVAEDADAAILTRKINGLFWNGQQLYVEDVRQQKAPLDQPYRSMNPEPEPQAELPYNSMNLAQNSSYNMMAGQQMMTPMYYMPIPAYSNTHDAYEANVMDTAQSYKQEKVQSAYPGISGFAQNASAGPQYGASQFDDQQDYGQPAKRSRWEDNNQDSANEKSLYGQRYDQNRDWPSKSLASPPRDQSRDGHKALWQTDNDGPIQPDFRANVRPKHPDYRSNAGPTQPDFRPNVRPTEPDFRSTIRPEERSDFVRPALLDKSRREFGSNIQRRENERQERLNEREIYSRRSNLDTFSRRPYNEFSRKPNDEFTRKPNDEFTRRPNDEFTRRPNDEFTRRPNDEFSRRSNEEFSRRSNEEFSRRPNERAEFSRRPNVPDRSNERQGTSQFSGRQSGREEPSRRPNEEFPRRLNEEFSRKPNDREDRSKKTNEHTMFSRRPNVPYRSNERQGTNQFSGRPNEFSECQGKASRFNQPNISRNNTGFNRNERPDVSRRAPVHDQRSIPDSRKRKFEEFKPNSSQQTSAPPKPFIEPIAAPPLTEQSKQKLNKRMRMSGTNKILHDIYDCLKFLDPDQITRRTFRQVVRERVDDLLGDKRMVTSMEILEIYRTKYPKSGDQATHEVVVERIAQTVAEQENGGNQEVKQTVTPAAKPVVKPVKPVVQPPPAAAPTQMAAPTRPPPPKPPTRGERRAMKNLKDAKQLMSQGKLPKFPLGDKSKVAQQRKEEKLGIIPETDPTMTAALTDEVDALLQICTDELVNPPEETTRQIYKSVCPEEFIGDMKTIITQTLARRVTDSGLKVVRVYGRPKLPKREVLEKFLIKFGVQSLRKSEKVKMFTAAVDTYKNFDKLCNTTFNTPDGISVHFKPFHAAPKERADQALLRKIRKVNLNKMIDRTELNLLDKDWPAKEKEIKAREVEKQAKLAAEWASFEERKALEDSQAVKTENVTGEPNGDDNTENVEGELTNITINDDDFGDQTNTTGNESNDYLHDDFHVIDEVNGTDSDIECLGDTSNQVFYIDEEFENGVANYEGVNNGNDNTVIINDNTVIINDNTVENNDNENAVGDSAKDNNGDKIDTNIEDQNDENIEYRNDTNIGDPNDKIVEDSENDANNDYNENEDIPLDGDGDFEMDDADIDKVDVDLEELDESDLEDY